MKQFFLTGLTILAATFGFAQAIPEVTPELVKEFSTSVNGRAEIFPIGNKLLIYIRNGSDNTDLWASDGSTSGTVLITNQLGGKDQQRQMTTFKGMTSLNGYYYFSPPKKVGTGSQTEVEPFITDGTVAGTTQLADLKPNTNGNFYSSNPHGYINFQGQVFFTAVDDGSNARFYRHTGSGAPQPVTGVSYVSDQAMANNGLFMSAGSSSTDKGLYFMSSPSASPVFLSGFENIYGLSAFGNKVLFYGQKYYPNNTAGFELYVSDGTSSGTILLKDLEPGSGSPLKPGGYGDNLSTMNQHTFFPVLNNIAYFTFRKADATVSYVYRTDGTPAGTYEIFSSPAIIRHVHRVGNQIIFRAAQTNGNNFRVMYSTDGGAPVPVTNNNRYFDYDPIYEGELNFGPENNLIMSCNVMENGNTLPGDYLLISDGTNTGTKVVKPVIPNEPYFSMGNADDLSMIGNDLYFAYGNKMFKIALDNYITATEPIVESEKLVQLYPNPVSATTVQISMSESFTGEATVQVSSVTGAIVDKTRIQFQNGHSQLPLNNLNKGLYLVNINSASGSHNVRLLIE